MLESSKPTFIYGLIDPRNETLRYVGKTVLPIPNRITTHVWRARKAPRKRHSMAWIFSLDAENMKPDYEIFEIVPPGGDWVEAERFWIGYFRMVGADLCNHTIGGEGTTGYKQSPESIAKRIKRGEAHHQYGKPMPEKTKEALLEGGRRLREDPERWAKAKAKRLAAMTPDVMANSIAGLKKLNADPIRSAAAQAKATKAKQTDDYKTKISSSSKSVWQNNRERIISAQNAGKGEEWRNKHSELGKKRYADPNNPLRVATEQRRKLSRQDVIDIQMYLSSEMKQSVIASKYGITQSMVSRIKSGKHGLSSILGG